MTKLAQGALDLNSRKCSIDFAFLQRCVTQLLEQQASGSVISTEQQQQLLASVGSANTSIEVLNLCSERQLPLAALICQLARQQAQAIVAATVAVEVFAINRKGEIIASTVTEKTV